MKTIGDTLSLQTTLQRTDHPVAGSSFRNRRRRPDHANGYTGSGSAPSVRSEYITRPGDQQYESLGWMSGHIVKYAIPKGVEVKAVKFRETGYDTEFAGTFAWRRPVYERTLEACSPYAVREHARQLLRLSRA
ncbi:MAG: hypothetical protein ACLR8Y_12305 [Alistipes indistinctus]